MSELWDRPYGAIYRWTTSLQSAQCICSGSTENSAVMDPLYSDTKRNLYPRPLYQFYSRSTRQGRCSDSLQTYRNVGTVLFNLLCRILTRTGINCMFYYGEWPVRRLAVIYVCFMDALGRLLSGEHSKCVISSYFKVCKSQLIAASATRLIPTKPLCPPSSPAFDSN